MKILVISARFPEAGAKGDQSRTFSFCRHLARDHAVTVVTAARATSRDAEAALRTLADVEVKAPRLPWRLAASLRCLARLHPAQVGWMMPGSAWRLAADRARAANVVLVNTARSLRGPLDAPVVLDHVDALSLSMRRRAGGPESLPVRAFATLEGVLMRRWEARAARWSIAQVATSREDAEHLPSDPECSVIPVGWDGPRPVEDGERQRDIDVVLTGNMRYPPNREAAEWFAREIMPLVRDRRPRTSAWVVGRGARMLRLGGVSVASDVVELLPYLRRAKVAVAPLRHGTGSPSKVIEAAASGAAVVATPWAAERFGLEAPTASDAAGFADAIVHLLEDDAARAACARAGRETARARSAERLTARLLSILESARHAGTVPADQTVYVDQQRKRV